MQVENLVRHETHEGEIDDIRKSPPDAAPVSSRERSAMIRKTQHLARESHDNLTDFRIPQVPFQVSRSYQTNAPVGIGRHRNPIRHGSYEMS